MPAITRLLPAQKYTFIDISYNPAGQHCQNCKKLVYYVGEVWGRSDNEHYFIGMDCAKTVTEQRDFKYHDRQFGYVRKAMKALNDYSKLEPEELAYMALTKQAISCKYDCGFKCVILQVPIWAKADFSDMIGAKDWAKIYLPVQEKLKSLGIALPEVPE